MTLKLAKGKQDNLTGIAGKAQGHSAQEYSLDDVVDNGGSCSSGQSRVYVLSEVGYDAEYFNETAYDNLLRTIEQDTELTHILVDGAITRLDRPEFLNQTLTYWEKDQEFCRNANKNIKNREQYGVMSLVQLDIVRRRLKELKTRAPGAKVVFSLHSDDVQYTCSAMLNEIMIRKAREIGDKIDKLKTTRRHQKDKRGEFIKEFNSLANKKGKSKERYNTKKRIETCTRKINGLEDEIQNLHDEQKLYREKKVRPAHQYFTREFIEGFYGMYQEMCDSLDVELVTGQQTLDFGGLVVDYAHGRHKTWHPIKSRDRQLVKEVHGRLEKLNGVDVVLESGHFGIGYKQLQKMRDLPDETNFKNQSSYSPEACDDHVTIVMALPFEDQKAIGSYVKGRKAVRMSGGKPLGTRRVAATDRYSNGSVAGLTIITKDADGIVGTEWIQFQNFLDGSILDQPDDYSIICASSDEHIGSPEESPIVRDGWQRLYKNLVDGQATFRGKPAVARGYINAGDVAEANSRKWDHRYHIKRDPQKLMKENLSLLKDFRPESLDDVIALAAKMTDDAMGGSVESMRVLLERAADYLQSFLGPAIEERGLRWAQVVTTGNHADAVMRDLGMRETDFFVQRLKALGVGVYEVGTPDRHSGHHTSKLYEPERVFIGGYSSARIAHIPDYGKAIDGSTLFGPIGLLVQHDPKGSGMNGVIGAGKNVCADLAIAGHTHDNKMKLYRVDDGTFSVAYRLATLQGLSPTEKYYAYSVPRTQAAQQLIMPAPGDFSEKAVPASRLREIGVREIREYVELE